MLDKELGQQLHIVSNSLSNIINISKAKLESLKSNLSEEDKIKFESLNVTRKFDEAEKELKNIEKEFKELF